MNRKLVTLLLAIAGSLPAPGWSAAGLTTSVFPADCWGVYTWGSWNPEQTNRETHPLIKGVPLVLRWKEIEPEPGVFRFESRIGQRLQQAEQAAAVAHLEKAVVHWRELMAAGTRFNKPRVSHNAGELLSWARFLPAVERDVAIAHGAARAELPSPARR